MQDFCLLILCAEARKFRENYVNIMGGDPFCLQVISSLGIECARL